MHATLFCLVSSAQPATACGKHGVPRRTSDTVLGRYGRCAAVSTEAQLPGVREDGAQCAAERVDHPGYLLRLAKLELIDRHQRMVERRIRAARFAAVKSLDTFDFLAIPSMNKALAMELARCEYIQRR